MHALILQYGIWIVSILIVLTILFDRQNKRFSARMLRSIVFSDWDYINSQTDKVNPQIFSHRWSIKKVSERDWTIWIEGIKKAEALRSYMWIFITDVVWAIFLIAGLFCAAFWCRHTSITYVTPLATMLVTAYLFDLVENLMYVELIPGFSFITIISAAKLILYVASIAFVIFLNLKTLLICLT